MDLTIAGGITMNDGHRIPRFGFGTYHLEPDEEAQEAVAFAIQDGYRLIDCARFYGNEAAVGVGIANGGVPRDELFVTSKVWNVRSTLPPSNKSAFCLFSSISQSQTPWAGTLIEREQRVSARFAS